MLFTRTSSIEALSDLRDMLQELDERDPNSHPDRHYKVECNGTPQALIIEVTTEGIRHDFTLAAPRDSADLDVQLVEAALVIYNTMMRLINQASFA